METILDRACANTGFEICEFGPDNDSCEKCKTRNVQLYFQGPSDAGKYYCSVCVIDEYLNNLASLKTSGAMSDEE